MAKFDPQPTINP